MTKDFDNPRPPRAELPAYWSNEPTTPAADFDRHRSQEDQTPPAFDEAEKIAADIMAEFRKGPPRRAMTLNDGQMAILMAELRAMESEVNAIAAGVHAGRIPYDIGRLALEGYIDIDTANRILSIPGNRVDLTTL